MNKNEIKKQLTEKGVEIVKGNYVRRKDVEKLVTSAVHENDDLLSGMTFKSLILAVQNESTAYNVRKNRKALELAVVKKYDEMLKDAEKDARYALNENINFIIDNLLESWE